MTLRHKSTLSWTNNRGKNKLQSVGKSLSNQSVDHSTQAYRTEIRDKRGSLDFWDQSNQSVIERFNTKQTIQNL